MQGCDEINSRNGHAGDAVERHLKIERNQQGLQPIDACPAAKTRKRSPDGGQRNPTKPDDAVDGPLQVENNRPNRRVVRCQD